MKISLKENTYELATTLRVVYALKDISGAKTLQEAISSIQRLDLDGQLQLLYAAYKAGNKGDNMLTQREFADEVLDSMGIFAIANCIDALTEGILYSGLTPEEIETKKSMVEAAIPTIG